MKCVFRKSHTGSKIIFQLQLDVNNTIIQINETAINESFEPVNDSFEGFEEFSTNIFFQIMDWVTPMLENLAT